MKCIGIEYNYTMSMPDTVLKGLGADQWSYSKVICYSYLWLIAGRLKGLTPHANQQPSLFSKKKGGLLYETNAVSHGYQ